jgi:hypothetical protein
VEAPPAARRRRPGRRRSGALFEHLQVGHRLREARTAHLQRGLEPPAHGRSFGTAEQAAPVVRAQVQATQTRPFPRRHSGDRRGHRRSDAAGSAAHPALHRRGSASGRAAADRFPRRLDAILPCHEIPEQRDPPGSEREDRREGGAGRKQAKGCPVDPPPDLGRGEYSKTDELTESGANPAACQCLIPVRSIRSGIPALQS